jgi:hypothetical protein
LILGVLFCATTAAGEAEQPTEHVFRLKYTEGDFFLPLPGLEDREVEFVDEPAYKERREVVRGVLPTGREKKEYVGFAWDGRKGKLYVDLNRNLDLTDDPPVAYEGTRRDFFGEAARLNVTRAGCNVAYLVDMSFYGEFLEVGVRSGWSGEVELGGRRWMLEVVDNLDGVIGSEDMFVLRTADSKVGPSSATAGDPENSPFRQEAVPGLGALDAFRMVSLYEQGMTNPDRMEVPERLSFDGASYDVAFAFESGETQADLVARFTESDAPKGALRIDGESIRRLIIKQDTTDRVSLAVLDSPDETVRIPCGDYSRYGVFVDGGDSVGLLYAAREETLVVTEGQSQVLKVGAPLNSSVGITRRGNTLELDYQLVGRGGEKYDEFGSRLERLGRLFDVEDMPKYTVYKGDTEVASGLFAYG